MLIILLLDGLQVEGCAPALMVTLQCLKRLFHQFTHPVAFHRLSAVGCSYHCGWSPLLGEDPNPAGVSPYAATARIRTYCQERVRAIRN